MVKQTVKELLELLGFTDFEISISEERETVYLKIKTENQDEASLLIGSRGSHLNSLQLIVNIVIYKKVGQWLRVVLNVNDWREERENTLKRMALNWGQKVQFSGESVQLPFLSAFERRIVHLSLKDNPKVSTSSEGEGRQRRLIIKPKSE